MRPSDTDRTKLAPEWEVAFQWIERELGGTVVRWERQLRWRPAWFIDLVRDGETIPLYFRGERAETENGARALEHEARVLGVLEEHGIPVPHVYGLCDGPHGIVMERSPGRANLDTAADDAERTAVLDDYMEILARMHAIDPAAFEGVGLARPSGAQALGLGDLEHWEATYRRHKKRPEPLIEFGLGWVRRNVPENRSRVSFIAADAGQFLFENGRVTALLDFELARLGDPAADLGGMRSRDLSEPLGDLSRAFARYGELTGEAPDVRAIHYHTIRFALCTPLAVAHMVADPQPGFDFAQYYGWYVVYGRAFLEVMAELRGIELEPVPLPSGGESRQAPAFRSLVNALGGGGSGADFEGYRTDAARRVALFLARADELGEAVEAANLDDIGDLLGKRPSDWREADEALERFVVHAGPDDDERLLRYFHRRVCRQEDLLAPAMRELEGASVQRID